MKKIFFTILCLGLLPLSANATVIDVHSTSSYGVVGGVAQGRAQGILVNSNFSVSAIGIYGNLVAQSFDIVVYSSINGHSAGSVLASASALAGGTGLGWNNIAFNFNFLAGNYYVVNWRPTAVNSNWGSLDYYRDNVLPQIVGPLTLVEGFSGFSAIGAANTLHPRLGYVTGVSDVPEPAMFSLLLLGLVGFGIFRRKSI